MKLLMKNKLGQFTLTSTDGVPSNLQLKNRDSYWQSNSFAGAGGSSSRFAFKFECTATEPIEADTMAFIDCEANQLTSIYIEAWTDAIQGSNRCLLYTSPSPRDS